jgi:rhamnose utilization protein RhaD (predicted bifunctional aldolase and dehydrogenase)/NAD(P)-dependent dehydrogenase (short-subunit alcohol dehydrogenase family)
MKFLKDLWDASVASSLSELDLLRYRSNLLGSDLRITNFGGGNTSSKITLDDPFTKQPVRVLAVKGSGGDLGSIKTSGFALLYMSKLLGLESVYRGEDQEDEMVGYYPLAAFGGSSAPASIDTPLHGFLPFPHVDHLHPDWAIALAASANGRAKMEEFNERFRHRLVWIPWQRPGFELGLMLRQAVEENPGCDGIILGSHGLFTWGATQRECYENSLRMIDDLGQFVVEHEQAKGAQLFGGQRFEADPDASEIAADILPYLRGQLATKRRSIAHFNQSPDVMPFVNSNDVHHLGALGTSCPDHFIRTRICPMVVDWDPDNEDTAELKVKIREAAVRYRDLYTRYYESNKEPGSPALRDPNASVVLIPGLGMFTFGKNKTEARITAEFYINAIHVMAGATALESGPAPAVLPQAKSEEAAAGFLSFRNYVALPQREAFRIEYWALEEAKLRRMPPEATFSRRVFLVVGGGSGIGRQTALMMAQRGAHLMIADKNDEAARETAGLVSRNVSPESVACCGLDLESRDSIRKALRETTMKFGGVDGVINTAAVFIAPDAGGRLADELWRLTLDINVTGNYLLADEAYQVMKEQGTPGVIVLTSSANAVVSKRGSEAYDVSKTAVNHLIRELAVGMAPLVRVNGIAPATVVAGSGMFPRERLIPSLLKYNIAFEESNTTEQLRDKLANFYAQRTLTKQAIQPDDCAEAICLLASDLMAKTTGHVIPVDGGLHEAFLR